MEVQMHPSVQKVAEFMQEALPADELAGVAEALALIAPAIWTRYAKVQIAPITLINAPISATPQPPATAT